MKANEILILVFVGLPIAIYLWFWIKHDLENKRKHAMYNPNTGKRISNFGSWLDKNGEKSKCSKKEEGQND